MRLNGQPARIAFQGEPGAFSEEAAVRLLGEDVVTVPRPTFDATFRAIPDGAADALLLPIENSLAGSVLRVYDLLLESGLSIVAETILPIEHHLIGCPGSSLDAIRSVASHPMALAQCERLFAAHPQWKRVPAEDTAGSVREILERGDARCAAIAGSRAAQRYGGAILASRIQDSEGNFTRFVLLSPRRETPSGPGKVTMALRLEHRAGALLSALEPFARRELNLLKIESRPIHGCPWEYQFFLDVEVPTPQSLEDALSDLRRVVRDVRVLGYYPPAKSAKPPSLPP
jgi:prephenate dehydratase